MQADGAVHTGSYVENAAFNPSMLPLQAALVSVLADGGDPSAIVAAVLAQGACLCRPAAARPPHRPPAAGRVPGWTPPPGFGERSITVASPITFSVEAATRELLELVAPKSDLSVSTLKQ